MSYKVLIVDDENRTCSLLSKMIEKLELPLEVVGIANNVEEGVAEIHQKQPNIVLLDIQMPDGSGFDLLNKINNRDFEVIFITAHEQFAIKAIKASTIDYILKPVDKGELMSAFQNAISVLNSKLNLKYKNLLDTIQEKQKKIAIRTKKSVFIIDLEDIIKCQSDRNYTFFYLKDGKKILTSRSLKDYEDILKFPNFVRCHRSYIINLDYLDRYEHKDGGTIIMKDGSEIPLSRSSKDAFLSLLDSL